MNWGQRGTGSILVIGVFGWMWAGSAIACTSAPALPVKPVALQPAQSNEARSAERKPADANPPKPEGAEEVRPVVVGWTKISDSPTADAQQLNREGLVLHKQGDHEAAVAKFGASLVASPGFVWGRYNNACALSRLGRTRESAALMKVLLLEDLPRFRPRFLADEDLSALRASPEGVRINASLPKIAKAYGQVLARGVSAYAFESRAEWTGEEPGADAVNFG